jgi:uncharacterized protein
MGRPPDGWLGPLHDMLPGRLAVCRLDPNEPVPAWAATSGPLVSVTRTGGDVGRVRRGGRPPWGDVREGMAMPADSRPLALSETGVISSVAAPLTRAGIGIFVVSTYDSDNILVKEDLLGAAQAVLASEGIRLSPDWEGA